MKQRWIAGLLLAAALLALFPASALGAGAADSGFGDVALTAWYCKDVTYARSLGIVSGVSATEFAPVRSITRGEFVTILGRFLTTLPQPEPPAETETVTETETAAETETGLGAEEPTKAATEPVEAPFRFADVPEDAFYAPYVYWTFEHGLVYGVNDKDFEPDRNITRQEIGTILYRAEAFPGLPAFPVVNEPFVFLDEADVAGFAKEAVSALQRQGLMLGDEHGNANPTASASRAEATALIVRFAGAALGHTHAYVQTEQTAPTCTQAGLDCFRCDCGSVYATVREAALGHDYQLTGQDGVYTYYACSRCGAETSRLIPRHIYNGEGKLLNSQMYEYLNTYAAMYPELIRVYTAGTSVNGAEIRAVELGRGSRYILMNGCIHACEYVTTNYLLRVIDEYAYAYVTDGSIRGHRIKPLLDQFTLVIVPCANPDGRLRETTKLTNSKLNANKVDLNHNFPVPGWPVAGDNNPGAWAGSEPETQTLMRLVEQYPVELVLDCHTMGDTIYYADSLCSSGLKARSLAIANTFKKDSGYVVQPFSSANGGFANYFRRAGKPGLTIEMLPAHYGYDLEAGDFAKLIWSKINSMPALAMELLRDGK